MAITIRKAISKDVPEILNLWKGLMLHHQKLVRKNREKKPLLGLVPDARGKFRKWVGQWMKSDDGLVLVAEDKEARSGKKIVGYSLNFIKQGIPVFKVGLFGHMGDLFVKQGYRGKSISSRFKNAAWKWFRKKKMKYASISYYPENKDATEIYRKWGFLDYHIEMRRKL